jgi:hypothetical protein
LVSTSVLLISSVLSIGLDPGLNPGPGKQKPATKKSEKVSCFELLDELLEAGGFSCILKALQEDLRIKIKHLFIKKKFEFFINCKMFEFFAIKNLDLDLNLGSRYIKKTWTGIRIQ